MPAADEAALQRCVPMIVTDPHRPDNPIIFANNAVPSMTRRGRDGLVGHNCRFLQGAGTDRETVAEVRAAVAARRESATEIPNRRRDGSTFRNALFVSPVFDPAGDRDGTETALVVDDRPDVAEPAAMPVTDFGYTVPTAGGPREAPQILDGARRPAVHGPDHARRHE